MSFSTVNVVVSGAAGQICYSLLPLSTIKRFYFFNIVYKYLFKNNITLTYVYYKVCSGRVFGPNKRIHLRLLDIPAAKDALEGIKMELMDCTFDLIDAIIPTTDLKVAFNEANVAILVGGFPRKDGMERKDLISKNVTIFKSQGEAIEKYANKDIKVLVVANPANTNCLILMKNAPSIPKKNFSCLTRLDHERFRSSVIEKINEMNIVKNKITAKNICRLIIWGNHSSTQVPDMSFSQVYLNNEWKLIKNIINDEKWIQDKLIKSVQQRGAAIIKARKLSSAMSAANAIAYHLYDLFHGTAENEYVSMGILSDGNNYNIPEDLIYSFPVKCLGNGEYEMIEGLEINLLSKKLMKESANELLEEKETAMDILKSQ